MSLLSQLLLNMAPLSYNRVIFLPKILGNSSLDFIQKRFSVSINGKGNNMLHRIKYKGLFKAKSRVKTWQVPEIWSQQLEHKQVPTQDEKLP